MGAFVKLITSPLAGPIASGVALFLFFAIGALASYDYGRFSAIETQLKNAISDVKTEVAISATYKAGLESCTAGVARLRDEGEKRTAAAEAAIQEASKISANLRRTATQIMQLKPSGDLCAWSDERMREHMEGGSE